MENYKILLVDDETDILDFLSYNLKKAGYTVFTANNGKDAVKLAKQYIPHLIILDVMMPEMDGIETCEEIRKQPALNNTVVAFLTARSEDYSQIAGFEAGADDYIAKPIKPKVLVSRVSALLKRFGKTEDAPESPESNIIRLGDLVIDKEKYTVINNGEELSLPRKEFSLLLLLISKPEKVFTREEIYSAIWGDSIVVGDRTIDVHIRKLREKIGEDYIRTVKGVGYKFVD
ncbi:MAG: response regulator transcription factor [Bacteroidales bacterium]|jgi:two-component system alkaline phosphatase synthesis response regulator PhoP|nr:response regulator transcription factor [Bacteroidales bacterium]MBQ5539539.1 response regulator transcription factor [Bacteroidales bacterium]MBR4677345.1 response regulator transcription factor [Bacteroidales bacterium]MCR4558696.1 response regulator transcription factor [Bacteroidales bacterium]MEE3447193.1 response regulator transcription factor [Bacteroidales bacterium]